MNKTYNFRLYPTKKQQRQLNEWLALCCETYNAALKERCDAYRMAGVSLGFAHQCAELPACKEVRPGLAQVNAHVLQNVLKRVDLAFQAFFRGRKMGERTGFPRYKSQTRYHSLTFPQYGSRGCFSLSGDGKLVLSKLGHVKMVQHRRIQGVPKTAIIKLSPTGKWFVSICCAQVEPEVLPPCDACVGVDVGLTTFATLSDGTCVPNPRFFREEEQALAKAQRRLARAARGSKERTRRRRVVARVHERIANRRENFVQQESRCLVNRYRLIAVEALMVRSMVKNPRLAKSISDAAWSAFFTTLIAKAEEAGRCVVKVPPAYTSQTCSGCGHRQPMPLSVRIYECPAYGLVIRRDHNASFNILEQAVG